LIAFVPPKSERAKREIPLPGFAFARLRQHKSDQARRRLSLGTAWVDLDLACERGDGSPSDPNSFSHAFRQDRQGRGYPVPVTRLPTRSADGLARLGVPSFVTSKVLGHASPAFTAFVYQHADEEMVARALAGLAGGDHAIRPASVTQGDVKPARRESP
jgi:integrase